MAQYILTGVILLICAYTDIRKHGIYKIVIAAHLAAALILHLTTGEEFLLTSVVGTLPGVFCLALSFLTGQEIGYGDAFLIMSCGFSLGVQKGMAVLYAACLCVGIWAIGLVLAGKGKRKTEIPFAPFLLAGAILQGLGAIV
ncbi:MAG: A24 family peptidase [Lachnospiraceae bacterium]|nr:A24 family peptidase [Lachnospiraceae bacterium]